MNTPNPNPSPECVYLGAIKKGTAFIMDYGVADAEELVRVADVQPADDVCCKVRLEGVTFWTPEFEFRRRATPVAALSQTLPAPGEVDFRALLIEAGRNAGAYLDDRVSDDFLKGIPEEVRLKIASLGKANSIHNTDAISLATVAAANDEEVARKWFPHLCFAGEPMHEGQFREPWPMDEERATLAKAIFDGWYEGNEDWDSPHNDAIQMRAFYAADAAIRLLSQGGGKDHGN